VSPDKHPTAAPMTLLAEEEQERESESEEEEEKEIRLLLFPNIAVKVFTTSIVSPDKYPTADPMTLLAE
jgi:hypothetical protein